MVKTSTTRQTAEEAPRPEPLTDGQGPASVKGLTPEVERPEPRSDLDTAFALMLADLNSRSILNTNRSAMRLCNTLRMKDDPGYQTVLGHVNDLTRLYKAALTMERDPEVIRRNTLASILMTLSPLVVGVQDLLDTPGFPLWKIGMEGLVLALEVWGSTQYLEAAKLISASEYELSLWEVERRVGDLLVQRGGSEEDLARDHKMVSEFFDGLRGENYPLSQRPAIFFYVSLVVVIISYSFLKARGK